MAETENLAVNEKRQHPEAPAHNGEDSPKENSPVPVSVWEGYSLAALALLEDC